MRVLVLGSGGREHALVRSLSADAGVRELICAPGSDAIARIARLRDVDLLDPEAVARLARDERIDLVVIGPEAPLEAGVVDALEQAGILAFGPTRAAARLESSKSFAKDFMRRHEIPTAAYRSFDDADAAEAYVDETGGPIVVKADGLAAGKAVTVCDGPEDAKRAIGECMREGRFGRAGARVVIEERLRGEEVSFYAVSDGERFVCLEAAQDHKPALDGDRGENTGGMGAYSPTPVFSAELERETVERVVRPTFDGMRTEGTPYRGVLYVGLMIVQGSPYVIEYNARFGDPELQVLLFRLRSPLGPLLRDAASGTLDPDRVALRWGDPAVCVVMTSKGYPRSYPTGIEIQGLSEAEALDQVEVFHSGTRHDRDRWLTHGGRVLGVTARGSTISEARDRAYRGVATIDFDGAQYRTDIGGCVLDRERRRA